MSGFIPYAAMLEVMEVDDLARFGITVSVTTKLDLKSALAKNDLMGIIGRRYNTPDTLPTAGGSRTAFLVFTRYWIYNASPESLIVTTPGGGMGKHPVVYDYERQKAIADLVVAWQLEWPELAESEGVEDGAWGSDKRAYDGWDGQQKQGTDAAADNDELFNGTIDPTVTD